MDPRCALTIAGSDSGGGAGIQADLRTFGALGVFGTSAITAVTAQNTVEVRDVVVLDVEAVLAQIDAVLEDLPIAAIKTGMLASAATIAAVGARLGTAGLPIVVDPVFISTSGHSLVGEGGVDAYREHMLPIATVVTPNRDELAALVGRRPIDVTTTASLVDAALELARRYDVDVVAKGGHLEVHDEVVVDVAVLAGEARLLPHPHVATKNTHGTGCTFAAATCGLLALGVELAEAITLAQQFVARALAGAADWSLGAGHGPIDHLGWSSS